jgi:hypothetical protein
MTASVAHNFGSETAHWRYARPPNTIFASGTFSWTRTAQSLGTPNMTKKKREDVEQL